VKQQVKIGQTNDNEVIITEGVKEGESVYLSMPKNAETEQLVLLPSPAKNNPPITSRE
jgi:aspartate/methionine/tyrosine aminotransferase